MKVLQIIIIIIIGINVLWSEDKVVVGPIAIIGAFDTEVELIKAEITDKKTVTLLHVPFTCGNLKGKSLILVETGVGKVNAAVTAALLLYYFKPRQVIFTGIAGSLDPEIRPADIIIGAQCAQHDYGEYWEKEGFVPRGAKNPGSGYYLPLYLNADPHLFKTAQQAAELVQFEAVKTKKGFRKPKIISGTILTGDTFVAAESKRRQLRNRFQGSVVEMEGAAVAQVCYLNNVPHIVIRSVSDSGDADVARDFHQFYKIAAHNSAKLVMKMIDLLKGE